MPDRSTSDAAPPGDFAGLYHAHFNRIATQLYAYLGDHAEAQDLTQEAFCRAFQDWEKISRYGDASAWVRRVAWNLATSRLRRIRVAVRHLARQREQSVPGPEPDHVALVHALATLPATHRRAVVLFHLCHLTAAEIATQEEVAEGTVRSWLTRGRAALADHFAETTQEVRNG